MPKLSWTLITFILYSVIIVSVFVLSGKHGQKTLYDKYLIKSDGAVIYVSNLTRAVAFYHDFLDFPLSALEQGDQDSAHCVDLPGRKKLFLEPAPQGVSTADYIRPTAILIRVRNGFDQLHRELLARHGGSAESVKDVSAWQSIPAGSLSEIFEGRWGAQFAARDYDGNILLFYRPKKSLFRSITKR